MPRNTPKQIPLNLARKPDYSLGRFEIGACNEAAVKSVFAFPDWPSPILALIGPPGSGKTHLATAWAGKVGANIWANKAAVSVGSGQPLVLDEANLAQDSELFAIMNMALNGEVPALLLTGTKAPKDWGVDLPDLKSRLANVPVAILSEPDDATLELIIRKLFDDQGRDASRDLVIYLLAYQDRSVTAMKALIAELDKAASQNKSDLTKAFAARYLASRENTDLFSD